MPVPLLSTLPNPTESRWRILRAGIQNLWEYDDQRFVLHRGRLLLRGRNESGKTKAVELLLPFLLDADLAPQRLDPFGSMSRPMRWNLLGSDDEGVPVRIGYAWLEFGRLTKEGTPDICTLGAGLRAKRTTRDVDSWFFITSKRPDRDFALFDANRVPLVRAKLEEVLGAEGHVYEKKQSYRSALNKRLFEMPDEQYAALIDALLQLRRPQLSKQLEPAVLSKVLSASLPPLDGTVVATLAEGFERLDRDRHERDSLSGTLNAVTRFVDGYRDYALAVVKSRAQALTRADSAYQRARDELKDAEQAKADAATAVSDLKAAISNEESESHRLQVRIDTIKRSEAFRAVDDLAQAEEAAKNARTLADQAAERSRKAQDRVAEQEKRLEAGRKLQQEQADATNTQRLRSAQAAERAAMVSATGAIEREASAGRWEAARGLVVAHIARRADDVKKLKESKARVDQLRETLRGAEQRLQQAKSNLQEAIDHVVESEKLERAARAKFVAEVGVWFDTARVCRVAVPRQMAILDARPELMKDMVQEDSGQIRDDLNSQRTDVKVELKGLSDRLTELSADRARLLNPENLLPPVPEWRQRPTDRPGAPFYAVCDFRDDIDQATQGSIEGALEAAGVLDAWVTADGRIDDVRGDVFLAPEPVSGPTLLTVLRPVDGCGVDPAVIELVLQSIAVASVAATASIGADGNWRLGPLRGALPKTHASYIGLTARERERLRRLALVEEELARVTELQAITKGRLEDLTARLSALEAEVRGFPSASDVVDAAAACTAAAAQHKRASELVQREESSVQAARQRVNGAVVDHQSLAAELDLISWADAPETLAARTAEFESAAYSFLSAAQQLAALALGAERDARRVAEEEAEAVVASQEATTASLAAIGSRERLQTLRETKGATVAEVLLTLSAAESELTTVAKSLQSHRGELLEAAGSQGKAEADHAKCLEAIERVDGERRNAESELKALARVGMFASANLSLDESIDAWSYTQTLQKARTIDASTRNVDCSPAAREALENRLVSRLHNELLSSVPPEMRIFPHRSNELLEYRAMHAGRTMTLIALRDELRDELATRDRLLGEEERKLFESFLSGEAHAHLRDRLREAEALVTSMNEQLEKRPTASGMQIRLRWTLSEEAPAGAQRAIDLLLKSGQLLSDADRATLRDFLQHRLHEARQEDASGSLQERILHTLDYRSWFLFTVESRMPGQPWKPLTRKVHGAGSGGQKAVMLHLPLFAAAAAFYHSAAPTAPRVIVLDEAFAGIDREIRGQLMGLLVEFGLDFVMTSFEEWGFYEELDGLSTYHLSRERGFHGVHSDWFVWDGKQAIAMETA